MTTEIFTKVTLGITELKVNPMQVAEHDMVCVLSRSKPAFYTVSVARMNELLSAEEQFENGYMAQKDVSIIKAGDTVRIKSLDKTKDTFGLHNGVIPPSSGHVVTWVNYAGDGVELGSTGEIYHIDDLELV